MTLHNHTSSCGCKHTKVANEFDSYFDSNKVVGVSITSEDVELDTCDATGVIENCFECQVIDQQGNEWTAYLGTRALNYWFNAEI